MLKVTSLKSKKAEEKFGEKLKKIHSKSLKEIQNTPEYKLNLMQIDCIKKVLVNNADVPEKLVSWLIEAVRSNTALEYTVINKKIFKYLKDT